MASMNASVSSAVPRREITPQFRSGTSIFSFLKKKDGNKKSDPVKMQRERVRQFSMWFEEQEKARDREYIRRRRKREINREEIAKVTGRYRLLYIPTSILLFTGITMLVMSLIPGIGSDTVFWKKRKIFYVVGPVIIGIGVVMLMITEAILSHRKAHLVRIRRIENLECTERQIAISQEPCKHQQQLLDTYFKSDKTCACRFDLFNGTKKPSVSVETQTDEILLLDYIQKTHGRGSCRKHKQKLCKMESVDSAAYSMESSATCFTDLYDEDEDEDVKSACGDENHPLITDTNLHLSDIGFVPVTPTITFETDGPVSNDTPSIVTPTTSNTTSDFQHYHPHLEPLKFFENEISNQSLSLPDDLYRNRANSEGHINKSFEYGISNDQSESDSEVASSHPQAKCNGRHLQVTKSSSLNNSVPNLNNVTVISPLLSVDTDTDTRRASWTTFN